MTSYTELKLSWELHQLPPEALKPEQRKELASTAQRQQDIESLILSSPEAAAVVVTATAIAQRLGEIRGRYESDGEFRADLALIGLDPSGLEVELARDLRIEGALERISSRVAKANAVDAEIYYRLNAARYAAPERRVLRHILLTFTGNEEKAAMLTLLEQVRGEAGDESAFAALALRHSQCPTAMNGGLLGTLSQGKLFPELDKIAFSLAAGEVSAPAESPIGWHLLRCDRILPAGAPTFEEVRERIIAALDSSRQKAAQRQWIKSLEQKNNGPQTQTN
ncbi:MAG: nitrogen fixation protein NifM [Rhodocyclaceae bacterium]|nr:nitrogen fixation protein NifM [Rhodocyclaceae bacterium]